MKKLFALLFILAAAPLCASDKNDQAHSPTGRFNIAKGISPVQKPKPLTDSRSVSPVTLEPSDNSAKDADPESTAGSGAGSKLHITISHAKPTIVAPVATPIGAGTKAASPIDFAGKPQSPILPNKFRAELDKLKVLAVISGSHQQQAMDGVKTLNAQLAQLTVSNAAGSPDASTEKKS